jgi:hypothetical protein
MRVPLVLAAVVAAALLAGCGGGRGASGTPPAPAPGAGAEAVRPALAVPPRRPGEIVVEGQASPASHGPFAFDGRYNVRFEQSAPEDPRLDFAAQTAFVADADRRAEDPAGGTRLFRAAARSGRRSVTLHGRFYVDVSFGDFPYAIRFTPSDRR